VKTQQKKNIRGERRELLSLERRLERETESKMREISPTTYI